MPTINANKVGLGSVSNQTSHSNARNATSGLATTGPTGTQNGALYSAVASGRSLLYSISRTFLSFDTSGVSSTPSSASVKITAPSGRIASIATILVPSTAFAGGNNNLASTDFNNLSFNTDYNTGLSTWVTGVNEFTLTSAARFLIRTNNYFICAVIQKDNDYDNVALTGRGGTLAASMDFSTTIVLEYTTSTPSGPSNIASLNGVTANSINNVNFNLYSSIDEINGVN